MKIQEPSTEQRIDSAATRVGGKIKEGQGRAYWRKLLLLEGVAEGDVERALSLALESYERQRVVRQRPLRLFSNMLLVLGICGLLSVAIFLFSGFNLRSVTVVTTSVLGGIVLIWRSRVMKKGLEGEVGL